MLLPPFCDYLSNFFVYYIKYFIIKSAFYYENSEFSKNYSKMIYLFVYFCNQLLQREKRHSDLPSTGLLLKWLQRSGVISLKPETGVYLQFSQKGAEIQGRDPSSDAFPGHKQRAESDMEKLRHELVHIWDARAAGTILILQDTVSASGHIS